MPKEQVSTAQERVSLSDFFRDVRGAFMEFGHMRERRAPKESVNSKNRELAKRVVAFFEQKRDQYLETGRLGHFDQTPAEINGEELYMFSENTRLGPACINVGGQDGKLTTASVINGEICPNVILRSGYLSVDIFSGSINVHLQIHEDDGGYFIREMTQKSGDDSSPIAEKTEFTFDLFDPQE